MLFELEAFIAAPTVSELNGLTKAHLALHYKLSASDSMMKTQLKKLLLQYLQDEKERESHFKLKEIELREGATS